MRWKRLSSLNLTPDDMAGLSEVLDRIRATQPDAAVILTGSAARGRMTWRSDIDLIALTSERLRRSRTSARIHLQYETKAQFLERLEQGDEFAFWAVRYGVPLLDPTGWWRSVSGRKLPLPDWRQKLAHSAKRLRTAEVALKDGDREAAEEELMMAATHCGRALILQQGQIPLSRPELPEQLAGIGCEELGMLLARLMQGETTLADLKCIFAKLRHQQRDLRLRARASKPSAHVCLGMPTA